MSNDTTVPTLPIEHVTDRFEDSTTVPFTRDKIEMGSTFKAEVYTPDERQQHVQVTTWGDSSTTKVAVDQWVAGTGETCTTLHLTVGGRTVDLSLWGVTLDALAVAVEAAQRD